MNQFLSRRTFILIPTMSILKIIFKPMQVLASSLASKEEWNFSKDEWKSKLSPESYYILREEGTERAFSSQLNNEKRKGVFHCAGCDLPLFSSDKKFDSGTGWPSFWDSIQGSVETKVDFKLIALEPSIIALDAEVIKDMFSTMGHFLLAKDTVTMD